MYSTLTRKLSGCSEAIILVSVATSFNGFDKNPASDGVDEEALAQVVLSKAMSSTFQELKKGKYTEINW